MHQEPCQHVRLKKGKSVLPVLQGLCAHGKTGSTEQRPHHGVVRLRGARETQWDGGQGS